MRRIPPLLLLAAAGCAQPAAFEPPVFATLDAVFTLGVGDQATIIDAPFQLRFLSVPADYRCPTDVECVWAGDARVRLQVIGTRTMGPGADGDAVELHTDLEPRAATIDGFRVSLERLTPAPHSETQIATRDYVAELRVSRIP
ncbi:MAG: hypothetical protein WD054_06790 [Gemmatimonadota bacterium]